MTVGMLALALGACSHGSASSTGPIPPERFVVAKIPSCPASVRAASTVHRPLVVNWQHLNRNVLPKRDVVTIDAPIVFEQAYGEDPLSMATRPQGSMCALTPLESEVGSKANAIRDRRTVAFVRSGHLEVDLYIEEDGAIDDEPLHLDVATSSSR